MASIENISFLDRNRKKFQLSPKDIFHDLLLESESL